jgi:tellurite resistance protein TehA-like permease
MNGLAGTAKAFATYSLVPYLGILFCPGAVLFGTVGVVKSYRSQDTSVRSVCYLSTAVGFVVLAVQLLLWWILYQAPRWAN